MGLGEGQVLKRRLVRALLLVVATAATFSISVSIARAAEDCRLKPGSTAPSGSRWLYRINRADHRHCWFLSSKAAAITHSRLAHRYRHLAGEPEAAEQDQQSDSDLQPASAPTDKTVVVAGKLPPMPQAAAPSVEQSLENLVPRSVPIIVYRLPTPSAQTVIEPTAPALSVRTVTPAATSKSNVVVLAGAAAAALCFAGGVFHFTRRGLMRSSKRALAKRHSVIVATTTIATHPPPVTTNWAEDLSLKLGELNRDRPSAPKAGNSRRSHQEDAVALPHAADWLKRPKPTEEQTSRQLADA